MASRNVQVSDKLADRFAREYIKDLNATQAYLRCKPDVTPATARVGGSKLLTDPDIQNHVATLQAERRDRLQIDADTVLQELAACGYSDFRHYRIDDAGNFTLAPDAPPSAARAVAGLKRRTTVKGEVVEHTVDYRLWDKPKSLIALAQHLGLIGTGSEAQLPPGGREIRVRWVDE